MINLITLDPILMLGKKPEVPVPVNGWIAGGAIRGWFTGNEKLSDVDTFFKDKKALDEYIKVLLLLNFEEVSRHKNAVTFSNGKVLIQCIIVKFYRDVTDVLDSFDYTICQFGWDGKEIYSTPLSLISTLRNHLGVHKLEGNVVDSLRRAFKYTNKGFYPCAGTLQKIAHSLRGLTAQEVNDAIEISPNGGRRIARFD